MKKYEVMYIVRPNLSEDELAAVVKKAIKEFDRVALISGDIIRHLITSKED